MVWGVIIALAIVGILLFAIIRIKQDANVSILTWIVSVLFVVVLSWETNRLITNMEDRSQVDDYIASVNSCLEACLPYSIGEHQLSLEEAHLAAIALKTAMPSMSRYIRVSDLEGKTPEAIADTYRSVINKEARRNTWNLVGWIVLTLVIGTAVIVLTMQKGDRKSKIRSSSATPSWKNDIDF